MKDTPRTDEEEHRLKKLYDASSDLEWPSFNAVADFTLCRQIERELNAANATIRQLREAITRLEAQQRGTRNAENMLCEMLEVDDGSQILDAIQALKERIKLLEEKDTKP